MARARGAARPMSLDSDYSGRHAESARPLRKQWRNHTSSLRCEAVLVRTSAVKSHAARRLKETTRATKLPDTDNMTAGKVARGTKAV